MRAQRRAGGASDATWPRKLGAVSASALLSALRMLPERRASAFGAALGRNWAKFGGPGTRDAFVNLRIAFPEWDEARRRRVFIASMENLGRGLAEFAWMGSIAPEELRRRVRVEGDQHLQAARRMSPNGGLVLLTAHLGNWEFFAALMYAHGYPLTVVYRPRGSPVFDDLLLRRRSAGGAQYLARGSAARSALRALADGRYLAMPYDQNCRRDEGVFAPFFSRLACSRTAPPRLAMRARAPVVPIFLHREPDGFHHVCHIRPAIDMEWEESPGDASSAALQRNVSRWNLAIEDEIRAAPEQWNWIHRRWRTAPPGEPGPPYG